tara:strand:+ start:667 stop:1557 length:891 start_codon:yes stop_codon:yes gene_type:complete
MSRCLVTGHKGYIGSKLFRELKKQQHEVMGIDLKDGAQHDLIYALKENADGNFLSTYHEFKPEYIFHLACWPSVEFCLENPVDTMRNNVLAGSVLLNFARKTESVKRVIYSSSAAVLGNGNGPTNPYGLHKSTTERECIIYAHLYGLDTVCLRYYNVYSEDQMANGPYASVIANWKRSIIEKESPFITGDGEQRRDMVHVNDVVSANIHCMSSADGFNGALLDVGTGGNISINELKEIVQQYHNVEYDYRACRPGEVEDSMANIAPLLERGWVARTSIKEGVAACFKFPTKGSESD